MRRDAVITEKDNALTEMKAALARQQEMISALMKQLEDKTV